MKLVTYDAGAGPRVGVLEFDGVVDAGWDGDMVGFIAAGAPVARGDRVDGARLLAPLRPRTLRDFLAFEGHLKNAYQQPRPRHPAGVVRDPRLLQGDAGHGHRARTRSCPGRRTPRSSTTSSSSPRSSARSARTSRPRTPAGVVFGYTIWNDLSARDVQRREGAVGMGPGKAKDWDGSNVLGPCIVTADAFDAADARMRVRVNGEVWGEDTTAHMHHTSRP